MRRGRAGALASGAAVAVALAAAWAGTVALTGPSAALAAATAPDARFAAGTEPGPAFAAGTGPVADGPDAAAPLDLASVRLAGRGSRLRLALETTGPWGLDQLARFPSTDEPGDAFICLRLRQGGRGSQLCLGPRAKGGRAVVGLTLPGRPRPRRLLRVALSRPSVSSIRLSFAVRAAGLRPGRVGWAVASRSAGPQCTPPAPAPCEDRVPDGERMLAIRLEAQRPRGCTGGRASFRTHGPRRRKLIGIGFDDGPGASTGAVLSVLRRFDSRATFFEVGQEMGGRGAVMRRILDSGSELANHSYHHEAFPSAGSLAATSAGIRRATGFTPCLFRPPGGAVDGGLIHRAGALGMATINWDVDPRDWAGSGSGAIAANVIGHARRGSIVVMHDGGGSRAATVAALPRILSHFRHRGYRFVTITELLGHRFTY